MKLCKCKGSCTSNIIYWASLIIGAGLVGYVIIHGFTLEATNRIKDIKFKSLANYTPLLLIVLIVLVIVHITVHVANWDIARKEKKNLNHQ